MEHIPDPTLAIFQEGSCLGTNSCHSMLHNADDIVQRVIVEVARRIAAEAPEGV